MHRVGKKVVLTVSNTNGSCYWIYILENKFWRRLLTLLLITTYFFFNTGLTFIFLIYAFFRLDFQWCLLAAVSHRPKPIHGFVSDQLQLHFDEWLFGSALLYWAEFLCLKQSQSQTHLKRTFMSKAIDPESNVRLSGNWSCRGLNPLPLRVKRKQMGFPLCCCSLC